MPEKSDPICKGCWEIGNNCGKCSKCLETMPSDVFEEKLRCAYNKVEGAVVDLQLLRNALDTQHRSILLVVVLDRIIDELNTVTLSSIDTVEKCVRQTC